jgi:putative proteasome-type protease
MQRFIWPGNRFITLLCSGNQLTIDRVLKQIQQDLIKQVPINLLSATSLDAVSDYIATVSVAQQNTLMHSQNTAQSYAANFIVSGQLYQQKMGTLLIYAEGNFIHESNDSPFLQIGEMKFGKPILDRMIKRNMRLNTAAHAALVSVDSTIRGNPVACMQAELLLYKNNSLAMSNYLLFDENSQFFNTMSTAWSKGVTAAIDSLPHFSWEN